MQKEVFLRTRLQGRRFVRKANLNNSGKIVSWESIEKISPPEFHDVPSSLYKLGKLKDGWLDGDGVALDHEGLKWLEKAFVDNYPDNLPLPYTYPTPDGDIQMEWIFSNIEIELEVNLKSHRAEWFCFDMSKNDNDSSRQLELDQSKDWEWMVMAIQRSWQYKHSDL